MALRTVDAVDVIKGIADLCGLDRENISTEDFRVIRQSINRRLQTAWEFDLWPELLRVEKRYFRAAYAAATTYTASTATVPTEVYFPATGLYYQNVKGSTGVDPANSSGVTNASNWADSSRSYSASNYSAATTYATGDKVFYPTTDRYYILHTAAVAGTLPTDTTKWGILTDFDPYVAYAQTGNTAIGSVFTVYSKNPKTTTRLDELDWFLSENGVQLVSNVNQVWLEYRIRTPLVYGDNYSSTTVYTAALAQIYYSSTTAGYRGNFYDCITTTSAGDSPESAAAKWSVVSVPLIFQRYLELGGHADYLRHTGQPEKADAMEALAVAHLSDQSQLLVGQQGQGSRPLVLSR